MNRLNLSFEEKVLALSTIRILGLNAAVVVMATNKHVSTAKMREVMDEVERTNYLIDTGIVERSSFGVVRFIPYKYPAQPDVVTTEYYANAKPAMKESLTEALGCLNCNHLMRSHKPTTRAFVKSQPSASL